MANIVRHVRAVAGALALAFILAVVVPVAASPPVNPAASSGSQDQLCRARDLVAMGELRPQLPELPVCARRAADLPDLDRLEYSDPARSRMAEGGRRHCWSQASGCR